MAGKISSKNKKPRKSQNNKKIKRRLHKGRTFSALAILLVLIAGIVFLSLPRNNAEGELPQGMKPEVKTTAAETGRADARAVIETVPSSMQREEALLYIKAREARLRRNGYARAAEDYMNAVEDILVPAGIVCKITE